MAKRMDAASMSRRIRSAGGAVVAEPEATPKDEPQVCWTPGNVAEITRHVRAAVAATETTDAIPEDVFYEIVLSTETPALIGPGVFEVLGHGPGEVDLSMANDGVAFLLEHGGPPAPKAVDPAYHIGLVTNIRLEDRKLRGEVRFGTNANAQMVEADYNQITPATPQGIRPKTSVGWLPGPTYQSKRTRQGNIDVIRRTGWVLAEESSVSVPGDPNSRRGRSGSGQDVPVIPEGVSPAKEGRTMKRVRNAGGTALLEVDDTDPRQAVSDAELVTERQTRSAEVQTAERQRIMRITDLCAKVGKNDRAAKLIADGTGFDEAFDEVMKVTRTATGAQPASEAIVQGVSKRDLQRAGGYNFLRAIRCAMNDNFDDSLEGDLHKAIVAKLGADFQRPNQRHVLVPLRVADLSEGEFVERNLIADRFMRAAVMGTGIAGTAPIIGQQQLEPVDLLRNVAMCAALGARVYPGLTGMVTVPVKKTAPNVTRMGENPATAAPTSGLEWDFKQVTPRAYTGDVPIPVQVIATASIDAQADAQKDLLIDSFLQLDSDAIYGSGTNNYPLGIYPDAECQELSMGAAVPSWKKFQKMIGMVANYNIPGEGIAAMTTPPVATELAATLKDAATAGYIWDGRYDSGLIGGYRATSTNQMSQKHATDSRSVTSGGTQHGFIGGSFGWLNFLLWGALVIKVDDVTLFTSGQIRVMSQLLATVLNRRPKAFVVAKGVAIT